MSSLSLSLWLFHTWPLPSNISQHSSALHSLIGRREKSYSLSSKKLNCCGFKTELQIVSSYLLRCLQLHSYKTFNIRNIILTGKYRSYFNCFLYTNTFFPLSTHLTTSSTVSRINVGTVHFCKPRIMFPFDMLKDPLHTCVKVHIKKNNL